MRTGRKIGKIVTGVSDLGGVAAQTARMHSISFLEIASQSQLECPKRRENEKIEADIAIREATYARAPSKAFNRRTQ
ncbi:BAR domain-containing protein [Methylorubrum suomiense]|uniref:hypothetical protein n=1 Tax=Methylorubrum suomiense TaxID=144191 RepID=UPI0010F9CA9C|nr:MULTISPECIES: hypothetical protein [Methylobacteriaceae]